MSNDWDGCERRKHPDLREKGDMLKRIIDDATQKAAKDICKNMINAAPTIGSRIVDEMEDRVIAKKHVILNSATEYIKNDLMTSLRLKVGDYSIRIILTLILIISALVLIVTKSWK